MAKRYYSKRYTRKRRIRYLVVGLILIFIMLVVVSAYSNIPQLEPIRKQIESFKSEIGTFGLSIGDTGVVDDVAITVVECIIADKYQYTYMGIEYERGWCEKVETVIPPTGAKYTFFI